MNSIPKFFASVVVIMIAVLVCISLIFAGLMVSTARTHHNNVISKIEESNFDVAVINECIQKAEEKGFALTITKEMNVSYVEYYKVALYYDLYLPLFGKVHTGKLVGYAYPGAVLAGAGDADHYFQITSDGVLSIKPSYRWATGIEEYASKNGKDSAGEKNALLPSEIVIPTYFNGVKVTALCDYMFANNTALTKVTFEEGVELIGDYAFMNCTGLGEIAFPESMTENGYSALKGTNITSLKAPFVGASPTASKKTGGYIGYIFGAEDYQNHNTTVPSSLTKVNITSFVTDYACYDMDQLTDLVLGEEIVEFEMWPFANCDGLTTVTIPKNVVETNYAAFYKCSNLETVNFESGSKMTILGSSNFADCVKLEKINLPDTVREIGPYCFEECDSLSFQTADAGKIPEGVESIGNGAYSYCDSSSFTTLVIPASVNSIDYSLVTKSKYVSSIQVASGNTSYCTGSNGELLTYDKSVVVQYPYAASTSYTVPSSVTKIFKSAFDECDKLVTLNFENGSKLTTIEDSAFSHCSDLSSNIALPSGVTTIGDYAFYHAGKWLHFWVGENVTKIGAYAFYDAGSNYSATYLLMDDVPSIENCVFFTNTLAGGGTPSTKYRVYVQNQAMKDAFVADTHYRTAYTDVILKEKMTYDTVVSYSDEYGE